MAEQKSNEKQQPDHTVATEETQKIQRALYQALHQVVRADDIASDTASKPQVKSTKHTFPIPDDLWADVETLLFALGNKKQNQLIIELLTKEVEANAELIKRFKR